MYRWQESHRPKKLPRWILAVCATIYIIALIYAFMPEISVSTEKTYIRHTVQGGETLWQVAKHYRPDADPRQIIFEIQQINGITPMIRVGQIILVPKKTGGDVLCLSNTN